MSSSEPSAAAAPRFSPRLLLTLCVAGIIAALVAPPIAMLVAACGGHFPFPRIFDRVVMVTVAIALWSQAGALKLLPRLKQGFSNPCRNWRLSCLGFGAGLAAVAVLWMIAAALDQRAPLAAVHPWELLSRYLPAALAIAILEEAFFRALLLDGLSEDFGTRAGLVLSAAVYAWCHQMRAPARFEMVTFQPLAGFINLEHSLAQGAALESAFPLLVGLFLLGLLLGEAYLVTGTIYLSLGLHASVVLGSKSWHTLVNASHLPGWLEGYGGPPLIGGAAAWGLTLLLLAGLRLAARRREEGRTYPSSRSAARARRPVSW